MAYYQSKYNIGLNSQGYIISQNKNGVRYYQKKRAPAFVNKFGGGDSSYRDATFWQYFVQTNFRNGAKQLKFDDPGKFWKSSDVDTTILEQLTLSKRLVSAGQLAAGIKVNSMEAWRSSTSWWNANYGYRQQITVTAPAGVQVPAGYPVKVTVDTAALQTAGKVQADRDDWRIVYWNGTAFVDLPRDYVSTTATFFATQAAISAGASDSNYFAYYGYSGETTSKQPTTAADWNSIYVPEDEDAYVLALLHFYDGSGATVTDTSGNGKNGTGTGLGWSTSGLHGRAGDFVSASNTEVDLGTSNDFNLGSVTLDAIVKFDSVAGAQRIVNRTSETADETQYSLQLESGKAVFTCIVGGYPNSVTATGTTTLQTGTWYRLRGSYDGTTARIFVNGTLEGTGTGSGGITSYTNARLQIGRKDQGGADQFDGLVHHAAIHSVGRSAASWQLSSEPTTAYGSEITTQPPSSSFDLYAGGSDGKVYKWDGTITWTEQFDCRRLTWYETGNDTGATIGDTGGTEYAQGQSFQLAAAQTIKAIEVYIKKYAGTPGNITVRIETNNAGIPSGTLANASAETTITAFTTTSYAWKQAIFSTAFSLSASTTYWLVLKTAAAANDNCYHMAEDASSPSYSGGTAAQSTDGGSTWSAVAGSDAYFRILAQATHVNCMLVTSVGGTQKLYVGTGDVTGQTNGDARLYSFDGTNWALTKSFTTATEAMINSLAEYTADSKVYIGVGPQGRVYYTSDFSTFTLGKDINIPQNPGYVYALKEYNRILHAGGGSPEFLPSQYYNGFVNIFDTTSWNILYPFDFTVIKSFEFYDAYLFMGTYRGDLFVYDTATLNPIFNFQDQYGYKVEILSMKYFDDKLYLLLYPQENSNETNVGIWLFDRRGMSLAHTVSGVTGWRCATVVNGTLMFGTGDDGYVYKLDKNNYVTQGWVQLSYFDANLPSISKLYNSVTIKHDPLAAGQSIVVYYKFKESDSWTTLGTSNTLNDEEETFSFPTGTDSKKISLKIELNTTDVSASPKLTEVVLQYSLYPTRKWMWTMRLKAKKDLTLFDKTTETRTATQIRSNLEDLLNSQQLYAFVDIDGTSYNVLVNDIDETSWVVNQDDVNEDEVVITLLEA